MLSSFSRLVFTEGDFVDESIRVVRCFFKVGVSSCTIDGLSDGIQCCMALIQLSTALNVVSHSQTSPLQPPCCFSA